MAGVFMDVHEFGLLSKQVNHSFLIDQGGLLG